MTRRQRETSDWAGDVWKIVPILQRFRPDLHLEVVDCAPTGLVIVSNLDAKSTVLSDAYDSIVQEYLPTEIEDYDAERYFDELDIVPVDQSRWSSACPTVLAAGWKEKPDIAIKVAAPTRAVLRNWGDFYFALGLAKAFSRKGYRTTIDPVDEWHANSEPGGLDLVLRGQANFGRQPGRTCLFWSISKGMRKINYSQADHVFWASGKMLEQAAVTEVGQKSSLLPQAFDADVMRPRTTLRGDGLVFVGRNRRGFERLSATYAANAGHNLKVWGPGWKGTEQEQYLRGDWVQNDQLSEVYCEADIVLNDHTPQMKERGLLSNRIFDALACGVVPITDDVGWLPDDMRPFVYLFEDQKSFDEAVKLASSETDEMRKERLEYAKLMKEKHSFSARATRILDVFEELNAECEQ